MINVGSIQKPMVLLSSEEGKGTFELIWHPHTYISGWFNKSRT